MKVEDVPQDLKFTEGTPVRHPIYAVDSEGKYQMVNSVGWEAKNEAIQWQLDAVQEECDEVLERIKKGESTLLEYYAVKNLMTPELLAHYADIPRPTMPTSPNVRFVSTCLILRLLPVSMRRR